VAGKAVAKHIARWDGTRWSAVVCRRHAGEEHRQVERHELERPGCRPERQRVGLEHLLAQPLHAG
jgi:hypothetical protein